MGVVAEGAGDEDIEACVSGFAGGGNEFWAGNGAEFGADEDTGSFFGIAIAFYITAFSADVVTRPAGDAGKGDFVFFMGLLNASSF